MSGYGDQDLRRAHLEPSPTLGVDRVVKRESREAYEAETLAHGATRAFESGVRYSQEDPDPYRTCFEVDRDRILHKCTAFRRLAGKTQVFVFPEDHLRTRLTHALEVAQVATSISRALSLNTALTEAIALAHDCGHGPFGHASEDAFSTFLPQGYDHATWGADVVLSQLNLTAETLDGVRNHSWTRPTPATPEGCVVSFADRIAYLCHDFDDAQSARIVTREELPRDLFSKTGGEHGRLLDLFITDLIETSFHADEIAMSREIAELLGGFRRFNDEAIYSRPESQAQNRIVIELVEHLVSFFLEHPEALPQDRSESSDAPTATSSGLDSPPLQRALTYVSGMTDRYVVRQAIEHLGWSPKRLPLGIDLGGLGAP
jgi:dGTPase